MRKFLVALVISVLACQSVLAGSSSTSTSRSSSSFSSGFSKSSSPAPSKPSYSPPPSKPSTPSYTPPPSAPKQAAAPAPARYGSFDTAPSVSRKDIAPPPSNAGRASVERDMTASVRKQEATKSWDAGFAKAPSNKDSVTSVPTSRPDSWHAGDAPPSYKPTPRTASVPQQTERVVVRETSSSNEMLLGYMLGRATSPSHAPVIVNGGGAYQPQPQSISPMSQGSVGQPVSVPSNSPATTPKEEESSGSWVWWLLGLVVIGLGAYAIYLQMQRSAPSKPKREAHYKLS